MMRFQVEGMSCGHCVTVITDAIHTVAPGVEVKVDLASGQVVVASEADGSAIAAAIEDAGYSVVAPTH